MQPTAQELLPSGPLQLEHGQRVLHRSDFILERRLGQSLGGEVWLARASGNQVPSVFRIVADASLLPVMKQELAEYDRLEGLGRLRGILRVHHRNLNKLPFHIEYEYGGDNLAVWALEHLGPMGGPERVQLFLQIAEVMQAAHSIAVRHMSLKPENIFVSRRTQGGWQVKLAGFGGARPRDAGAPSPGGWLHLAPELLHDGLAPATLASDMYALGVLLLQVLTGDFSLGPHPGYEEHIYQMQLRACITGACNGEPERRMRISRLINELQGLSWRRVEAGPDGAGQGMPAPRKLPR
jgi:non-specific serine/threonine protein kinase